MSTQAYEKLGVFYLGRYHDLPARKTLPDLLLYNSNDLLTHALCVGMTGSGKTGLCFDIIEEAAIDGIPAILIDPKGDLANLLLTFPDLRPQDFEPWIDSDQARTQGLSRADFAAKQAELWKKGLASWDQDGDRIRRLRNAADFTIYTPGSNAGVPVSILNSFAAPPQELLADAELLRERVNTTVSSLLALIGMAVDSTKSREAIFLGNVIQYAWQNHRDLDLSGLIQEIQNPSLQRIGVMDVESFYPAKDRFSLALAINGLIASPGFRAWLEGEPLDIQRIYYTPEGKPRVAIFSIAHLNDAERMFFVTLLLNQLLGWMRAQSGATSLRALLYMDEIFGYFPPTANPPSKLPLLTLLKQGRAFGLGLVLATQNPVDLDYKGLANIGAWFLGRLQTDRDKLRVLDGLEGAATTQGSTFNRSEMEQTLAALGKRVFLLHNVHEDGISIFESRWAMSYLRGPMTRDQIKTVMSSRGAPARRPSKAPAAARLSGSTARSTPATQTLAPLEPDNPHIVPSPASTSLDGVRPTLPPAISQFFLPAQTVTGSVIYKPMLLGVASVRFADPKIKVDVTQNVALLTPINDDAVPVDWAEAHEIELNPDDLERDPVGSAQFAALPPATSQAKNYPNWQKDFVNALFASRKITLLKSTNHKHVSAIDESEGDFRVRLAQISREERDAAAARLRAKYAPKIATLNERLRRAEQAVAREAGQARSATISTALSFGSTLLGAFLGRKAISSTNISKAATAMKGVGRTVEQSQDVARAGETVEAIKQQLTDLDSQFQAEVATLERALDPQNENFETIELRPSKSNIAVKLVSLAWSPHVQDATGNLNPAF